MNELMRATIHEALEVEEPYGLRSRVIAAVPMDRPRARRSTIGAFRGQWAYGFVALLLTAALVAGLVYWRVGGLPLINSHGPHAPSLRLGGPSGIAVGPDGTIYVADYVSNRVFRLQSDRSLVTVAGGGSLYEGPAIKSNLFGPVGLAVDSNGDLFIADNPGAAIRLVDPTGNLTTYIAWHSAGAVREPWGLAADSSGLVYASLGGGVSVIRPDRSVTPIDLSGVPGPAVWPGYLTLDGTGNLYIADMAPQVGQIQEVPSPPGGCRILRVAPDRTVTVIAGTGHCGYSGDGGPATSAQLNDPKGLAFDSAGNLYFADSHNYRVRRIDVHGVITTIAGNWGIAGHTGDGGPAVNAVLGFLGGVAIVQGRFVYVSELGGFNAYGAVRAIDLRTGTIRTVVDTYSKVVS